MPILPPVHTRLSMGTQPAPLNRVPIGHTFGGDGTVGGDATRGGSVTWRCTQAPPMDTVPGSQQLG